MEKKDFEHLFSLVRKNAGWSFNKDHAFFIYNKIDDIIRNKSLSGYEELMSLVENGSKAFFWSIIESFALTNGSFFMDSKIYKPLKNSILPHIINSNKNEKKLNVLSLGSGNGQELYSVAIMLKDIFGGAIKDWKINLTGLDIASDSIIKSQKGYYTHFEIQNGLNAKDIMANFSYDGEFWQAKDFILNMVNFKRFNFFLDDLSLIKDYDLIIFRNVINLFSDEDKIKVIENIAQNQKKYSFICLETSDSNLGMSKFYKKIKDTDSIYVRFEV